MTVFIHSWIKNGWRTNNGNEGVKNADMIRHLLVLLRARAPAAPVNFKHVRGHSGHEGNEAADKLARCGAMYPALPDRTDWLDPDAVDESAEPSPPQQQSSEDDTKSEKMVDLEVSFERSHALTTGGPQLAYGRGGTGRAGQQ
jgi:ribonuclease HI